MAEHVVIAGKGGIGKTTTAANLCGALAEAGKRVVLVGYDPRCNATATVRGNRSLRPLAKAAGTSVPLYAHGYRDALCIEAGELTLNGETSMKALWSDPLLTGYRPDYVIHDVSREPCAEFVLPPATEGVLRVFVVTSADMGALHAVNQLFYWLNTVTAVDCRFGGVIVNNLSGPLYEAIVADFASQTGASIVGKISHSLMVSASDFYNETVIEAAPLSHISYAYRKLAGALLAGDDLRRPRHLQQEALKQWALRWGEIITELETGLVRDGCSI